MEYILDGRKMTTPSAAHDHLQAQLALPAYYGRNLDALYDCLTDMDSAVLVFHSAETMVDALGAYGEALLATLREVVEENPALELKMEA